MSLNSMVLNVARGTVNLPRVHVLRPVWHAQPSESDSASRDPAGPCESPPTSLPALRLGPNDLNIVSK
jgi:hypothetical protein